MVEDPGAAAGARPVRPLNRPQPVAVEATPRGMPRSLLWRGVFRRVVAVRDSWRIDDEWWRDPIVRRYFVVEVEGGQHLTVYCDLVRDLWYAQPDDGPRRAPGAAREVTRRASRRPR